MALNLSSLSKFLPSSPDQSPSDRYKPVNPPLNIKVMSWNIHGSAASGSSQHRNRLIPLIITYINPDVLLLQETKTDTLINTIKRKAIGNGRNYQEVSAGNTTESRVLYDSRVYESIEPRRERIFQGEGERRWSLMEVLDQSIEAVFPRGERGEQRELRGGRTAGGMRELYRRRIAIVGLKRCAQELSSETVIVFMSFHNVHNSQGREIRDRAANGFCDIVAKMKELTGSVVMAGADLNCEVMKTPNPMIPDYKLTLRRSKMIDYFIIASPPDTVTYSSVTALDFCGAKDDILNPLHGLMRDLLRPPIGGTINDYDKAINHDPLMCDINVTTP